MKRLITLFLALMLFGVLAIHAQTIEVVGLGANGNEFTDLNFSDVSSIDYILVEAVYKSLDPVDGPVEFSSSSQPSILAYATPVEQIFTNNGTDYGTHPSYFRAIMDPASSIRMYAKNNAAGLHSFVAYVFRSDPADHYSLIDDDHLFFYHDGIGNPGSYSFNIAPSVDPRDITTTVVISELAYDIRQCVITVTAGPQIETHTITQPNFGPNLNLEPITLYDVPADVTTVTVSIYSPNSYTYGDSFITGNVVLDVEKDVPPAEYCTLTQGFYGNYGGQFNGQSTVELLNDLLATDLVVGGNGNTLTLTQADVDCLISRLPGGGPSATLNGAATCDNPVGIQIKKGKYKNTLLAQTITLGLNLRLDGYLGGVVLSDLPFSMNSQIMNYLGSGATINDLFGLANDALAGENIGVIGLGSVTDAAGSINDHFDECGPLNGNTGGGGGKGHHKSEQIDDVLLSTDMSVYPNPVSGTANITFSVERTALTTIELYDLQGRRIDVVYNGNAVSGESYNVSLNTSGLQKGMYLLVLRNGDNLIRQKLTVN